MLEICPQSCCSEQSVRFTLNSFFFFPLLLFSPEGPHEKEGEGGLVWFLFAFKCSFISQSVMQSLYSGLCRGLCLLRTTGSARGKI